MARITINTLREEIAKYNQWFAEDDKLPNGTFTHEQRYGMQGVDWQDADGKHHTVELGTSRACVNALSNFYNNAVSTAEREELAQLRKEAE